jgi:RNA-directed DNA polymerase
MSDSLASVMQLFFRGDTRRVMQQNNRAYSILHTGPVTELDFEEHLRGSKSIALYLLDEKNECSTLCLDIDIPKIEIPESAFEREKIKTDLFLPEVAKIINYIKKTYTASDEHFLIEDTGGRGYHIWLFFERAQKGEVVLSLLSDIKINAGFKNLEIFPPTYKHGQKGFSKSLVRLPLGLHRKYNNCRSSFLKSENLHHNISIEMSLDHLKSRKYLDPENLKKSLEKYNDQIEVLIKNDIPPSSPQQETETNVYGSTGDMLFLCPALSRLVKKAEQEKHLKHNERLALATSLIHLKDGREKLHDILSNCSDYDSLYSEYQIKSVSNYGAFSCKKLQSKEIQICDGWCNQTFETRSKEGLSPSPLWFAKLNRDKESLKLDVKKVPEFQQIASLENLYHAWKQAKNQAFEREIFDDIIAYEVFENNLWSNLLLLKKQLLDKTWKHNSFILIKVPKAKETSNYRPYCNTTPREAIVQLAILNIIGPRIDSTFNSNSLGNRLASFPKSDSQIFLDWKKQNRIRELKRNGFSQFPPEYHYVITDIRKFYEDIRHEKLLSMLRQYIDDQNILNLLQQYIEASYTATEKDLVVSRNTKGIPQGPALSALLANLYLSEIDLLLKDTSVDFVRYVDDIAILYNGADVADLRIKELQIILENEYGLTLSKEKTTEPIPANDSQKFSDWLDEARYDFIKSSSSSTQVSEEEKNEFYNFLNKLTLDEDGSNAKLIKYLGFYIRFTERVENGQVLKAVYAIAINILKEERPRHNATCIAIRSLIKACSEPHHILSQEVSNLIQERQDEYFKIILCQEAARLTLTQPELKIAPMIIEEICKISIDVSFPVAAASSYTFFYLVKDAKLQTENTFNIALGNSYFIRPYATHVLLSRKIMNETSLARIVPESIIEAEIHLSFTERKPSPGIIHNITNLITEEPRYTLLLPSLAIGGLKAFDISSLKLLHSTITDESTRIQLSFYLSEKIAKGLIGKSEATLEVSKCLNFLLETNNNTFAKELYKLARALVLISEDERFQLEFEHLLSSENVAILNKSIVSINGLTLLGPVGTFYFLQNAIDKNGIRFYQETISNSELNKIGKNIEDYDLLLKLLEKLTFTSPKIIQLTKANDSILIATEQETKSYPLRHWLKHTSQSPVDRSTVILKLSEFFSKVKKSINKITKHSVLIPVPTTHTIYISDEFDFKFENISLSIIPERRYIGLSEKTIQLDSDEWEVMSIGLLFFELITMECAVTELYRDGKIDAKHVEKYEQEFGYLFSDIIKKSCSTRPEHRYKNIDFLCKDIYEWAELERVLLGSETISQLDKSFLRSIWSIDIQIERRILADIHSLNQNSISNYNYHIHNQIIRLLKRHKLEEQEWLKRECMHLTEDFKRTKHISSKQILNIANAIESNLLRINSHIKLKRQITFQNWLTAVASNIEIESLRRGIYISISVNKYFFSFVLANLPTSRGTNTIKSFSNGINPSIETYLQYIDDNINDISNRIKSFLNDGTVPSCDLQYDLPVLVFIILIYTNDIIIEIANTNEITNKHHPKEITRLNIGDLINSLISISKNIQSLILNRNYETVKYLMLVYSSASINDYNILRRNYRNYDTAKESLFGKLKLGDCVNIKLHKVQKTAHICTDSIIPILHNHFDSNYSNKNAPFSLDYFIIGGKVLPYVFTLPSLTSKQLDGKILPIVEEQRLSWIRWHLAVYGRKRPILAAFVNLHFANLVLSISFFIVGIFLNNSHHKDDPISQAIVNIAIYGPCLTLFYRYINGTYKRLNPQHSSLILAIKASFE